jgi:hypothetical protein
MTSPIAKTLDELVARRKELIEKMEQVLRNKGRGLANGEFISPDEVCGEFLRWNVSAIREAIEDSMRYRRYQRIVYEDQDASFDAYDPEGMDAELTRRLQGGKEGDCCANEKRNVDGGCDNCGDPCL